MADFRVTCPEARFSVNFTRLGFHPGFGLTASLPRSIGAQQAALLMYTGRRLTGEQALAIGLADYCVPLEAVRHRATELATEIAQSAPLAIVALGRRCAAAWLTRSPRRRSANTRTGLAAQYGGLPRGRQGDGRAPVAGLQGALGAQRSPTARARSRQSGDVVWIDIQFASTGPVRPRASGLGSPSALGRRADQK